MVHDSLNPHVVNMLLCLGGIAASLVLIAWGRRCDRREAASAPEAAAEERVVRRPRRLRGLAPVAPRVPLRQVA